MGVGIFEIIYFNESGGTWWGWILILFSIFWLLRGNKFRRQARTISAGYQYFDNNLNNDNVEEPQEAPQRRLSNAPQIVVVSSDQTNNPSSSLQPNSSASIVQGGMAPNALSQPMMSAYDAPLIRNAVPPSPFVCTQGNDSYIVPSIPMANVTTISRISSGPMTPRGTRTIGNVANENDDQYMDDAYDDDNDTQPHAEDSIYIDEDNEDDNDNDDNKNQENKSNEEEDEDDGKNEIEPETPKGPSERKTSEGNVTFS
eukprot:CAMPEP_0201566754 /NCGR_PEP_ID=MMETSP0190_2-20130828/6793_1 /ASSEMBLY_ACC=CAM_ASM_000263 /TAXON_ID=37353 /ORGANISM="Rosalina sp." /LENGTH=256 /DNA_ID=CAMNT_0047985913 /DNA_START=399 /DNA_END=1169 /DNA_ORIENTATION=-